MKTEHHSKKKRIGAALALAAAALLLAGSIHPERRTGERTPGEQAAERVAAAMAPEIPFVHRAEWQQVAGNKGLLLFRCGLSMPR